jgi:hypothetical protein
MNQIGDKGNGGREALARRMTPVDENQPPALCDQKQVASGHFGVTSLSPDDIRSRSHRYVDPSHYKPDFSWTSVDLR